MDYEKYYDIRNNLYVIHFANNNGFSIDQLVEMFSCYGNMTVEARNGQFGLCFIRYENLEDTIKCLNAFKNHKSLKILQHKHKINGNSKIKNSINKKQKFQKTQPVNTEETSNKGQNHKQFDCNSLPDRSDHDHSIASSSSMLELLRIKSINKKRCSSLIDSEFSDNNSKIMEDALTEDEIPSLTYSNKKKIVQAQEVIVANIHPALGVQDILTLFKDYHPIGATFMKLVPDTKMRYCHAFFTSASDALAVEKKFDKYLLRENVLIVLRLEMLIEEALL